LEDIKQYHLHQNDYSKLHFDLNDAASYFDKNRLPASKPHRHSFYQLIWFRTAGQHYIDYQVIEHPKESVIFINKNQVHYFCPNSSNQGFLYHFNDFFVERFNADLMKRFSYSVFNEMGAPFVSLSEADVEKMEAITRLIENELHTKDHFYREQVFSFFQTLLFQIERLKKKQGDLEVGTNADYDLALSFKKLIGENMSGFPGIDELSSMLNVNSKKLTSVCRQYLSDTPANIIRQSKILEAKRMLANRKVTIQEVAYAIGFDQPTYFTKYFKKATGITPKEFVADLPG